MSTISPCIAQQFRYASCSEPATSQVFAKKRLLKTPLVAVRVRGNHHVVVAFNSALSQRHQIPTYSYTAIRHDAAERTVDFLFSRDELAHGGSYALAHDGGSKSRGTPARVIQVPPFQVPFLTGGRYRANSRIEGGQLVLTIHLDRPAA